MQRLCTAVAVLAFQAVGGHAAIQRQDPVHLRTAPSNQHEDSAWKAPMAAAISHFVAPATQAVAANSAAAKGDEAKKKQPVSVQVPQEQVQQFTDSLSDKCSKRFTQMLNGEGPQMHTFGSADVKATEASCTELHGAICTTTAHVVQAKQGGTGGRKIEQTIDVTGDGCLPRECMDEKDLGLLSNFMHLRAKDTAVGAGMKMSLHVDCTKSGGGMVTVGDAVSAPSRSGAEHVSSTLALMMAAASSIQGLS